jgi:outer membrane protein OmpA-like peptidoglycan-associated protein
MKRSSLVFLLFFIALSAIRTGDCGANPGIIPVSRFTNPAMPGGIPEGWSLEKKTGQPIMKIVKDDSAFYLHLISPGDSSFGVRKEAHIDIKKYPVLSWRWKVTKLPRGGDVRKSATDDQALQIYVAFKESGFLGMNTPIVGYIWDNEAPKGWSGRSPQTGGDKLRYIVLRNKTDKVGQWYTEKRNIYQDYKKLFADFKNGDPQGLTTGLQVHINSQHTKGRAESMIGDIYFSSESEDIALAEAGKEAPQERTAKISAIRPQASVIKKVESIRPLSECINIDIEFDTDSTTVEDDYQAQMQKVADFLRRVNVTKVNITGHTDNVGSEEYNLALSGLRAENVKKYLVERYGVNPQRLDAQGIGPAQPAAGNDTPEGRQRNRRVAISGCFVE